MKLNEKSQFLIVPELAYRNGGPNRIPPNSTVLFEIELCGLMESVISSPVDTIKNDFDYVYKFCLVQCVKGKRMFRVKNYHDAIKEYTVAVHQLEKVFLENYEEQEKSDELLVQLCTNLLICYTYVQNPKKGCIFAQRIYDMKKNKTFNISAKVYFNHAKCLRMLGNFDKAERKLYQAKRIEAHNPEILQEYLALKKTAEESKKRDLVLGKTLVNCK
ncbi:FKBP C domain containing protein [Asbolus verrucosus]|uniref:peptidylprolyl isomerase n=1 Tax=Asbolus verrucosus TaxID=1661398 RepID=A0A482VZT6_ASBVE|nr:FKBP C domain containing protein [Asbolus verrucosus]